MTIQQDFEQIKSYVGKKLPDLKLNGDLIDMLEGNLLFYVDALLKVQLAPQSYDQARHRIAPINLLKKINDKLTVIYNPGPLRTLEGGNEKDKEMFSWYLNNSNINRAMKTACENYSLCKASILEPLIHDDKLFIRILQNNDFTVMSDDKVNPLSPTHVIVLCGNGSETDYMIWTDEEVKKMMADGKVDQAYMTSIENPEGVNIYGELPFIYINSSQRKLVPTADVDLKTIVTLIPLLLSDLNYAVMFQCFSIVYGINVDDAGLKRAPNAFWALKSDATSDNKPEVGVIKPQVDIDQVLGLIQSELSLFLNSRGIKPGSIGTLDKDSFASGLSKMVDQIDTVELRQNLVSVFTDAEWDLWNFILHVAHPVWIKSAEVPFAVEFTKDCFVQTKFAEQLPLMSRGQIVSDQKAELDAGFTTKKRAVQTLNPEMSEDELNELMTELEEEDGNQMAEDSGKDTEGPNGPGSGEPS